MLVRRALLPAALLLVPLSAGVAPAEAPLRAVPGAGMRLLLGTTLWTIAASGEAEGRSVGPVAALGPDGGLALVRGRLLVSEDRLGHRRWARRIDGTVAAAGWDAAGRRLAVVVRRRAIGELAVIGAGGRRDPLRVRAASVPPAWRADGRQLAYVGPNGRVAVLDLAAGGRRAVEARCGPVLRPRVLAFAPRGRALAVVGHDLRMSDLRLVDTGTGECSASGGSGCPLEYTGIAWRGPAHLTTADRAPSGFGIPASLRHVRVREPGRPLLAGRPSSSWGPAAALTGLAVSPDGVRMVVGIAADPLAIAAPDAPSIHPGTFSVWLVDPLDPRLRPRAVILRLRGSAAGAATRHGAAFAVAWPARQAPSLSGR
jgi:hypothetical protein